MWWNFITLTEMHHFGEIEITSTSKNSSLWYYFIMLIKCVILMKIYRFKETISHWGKYPNIKKINHFDESSSLRWKHSSLIKGELLDEKSSLGWNSIALMKIRYFGENFVNMIELDSIMKIYHCDEFIIMVKILDLKFIPVVKWGLYTFMINFTFLCLVVFGHFHTFLDGWVGGVNQD